ncbi:MAG: biotin--[acetyl-CoA-carboxylase] ligase [Chromatiaceae bacterium]|nr:biotin--[acetyl-CoA-carboxylase] ligase [Gammaproteobacteria bacterium]MCP5414657.1 biotin--[acetyl-CoA-carboxylase] ligase [Chromatiaceae bacterium]
MRGADSTHELLRLLADGRFHSGQRLAEVLGIGRSAVWKRIKSLESRFALDVDAVRGRGYRFRDPVELLVLDRITSGLDDGVSADIDSLELELTTESTNSLAAAHLPMRSNAARVFVAEFQSAGRGRRGRRWVSSLGDSVCLSVAWQFDKPLAELSSLSLAAGVAVAEALSVSGVTGHQLKWPNDLVHRQRKLAGILVEVSGEASGPATAIIGVGVNVRIPSHLAAAIDQPWVDMATLQGQPISRNQLTSALISSLVTACRQFSATGFESFAARWHKLDALVGQHVSVHSASRAIEGRYAGISATGALLLDTDIGRSEHFAGEVSVRPGHTP